MAEATSSFGKCIFSFLSRKYKMNFQNAEDSYDEKTRTIATAVMMLSYAYRVSFKKYFKMVLPMIASSKENLNSYVLLFARKVCMGAIYLKFLIVTSFISEISLFLMYNVDSDYEADDEVEYSKCAESCFNYIYENVFHCRFECSFSLENKNLHELSMKIAKGYDILEDVMNMELPFSDKCLAVSLQAKKPKSDINDKIGKISEESESFLSDKCLTINSQTIPPKSYFAGKNDEKSEESNDLHTNMNNTNFEETNATTICSEPIYLLDICTLPEDFYLYQVQDTSVPVGEISINSIAESNVNDTNTSKTKSFLAPSYNLNNKTEISENQVSVETNSDLLNTTEESNVANDITIFSQINPDLAASCDFNQKAEIFQNLQSSVENLNEMNYNLESNNTSQINPFLTTSYYLSSPTENDLTQQSQVIGYVYYPLYNMAIPVINFVQTHNENVGDNSGISSQEIEVAGQLSNFSSVQLNTSTNANNVLTATHSANSLAVKEDLNQTSDNQNSPADASDELIYDTNSETPIVPNPNICSGNSNLCDGSN